MVGVGSWERVKRDTCSGAEKGWKDIKSWLIKSRKECEPVGGYDMVVETGG